MTAVAITGAAGRVGKEAREAFDDGSCTLFTHREHDDLDSRVLDVTDGDAVRGALVGHDVVVHLAWGPSADDSWTEGHPENVRGTYNVYEAARTTGIERIVFASSNHVTGMYNSDDPTDKETLVPEPDTAVAPGDPVRPDSYYGVAKVTCEAMGSYYADRFGIDVVNLRIGWLMARDELRAVQDDDPSRARFARAMWLSPRDCRGVVRAAATASLSRTPLTLNAVSRNEDRYLTLTETMLHLDYRPRDDAAEVLSSG